MHLHDWPDLQNMALKQVCLAGLLAELIITAVCVVRALRALSDPVWLSDQEIYCRAHMSMPHGSWCDDLQINRMAGHVQPLLRAHYALAHSVAGAHGRACNAVCMHPSLKVGQAEGMISLTRNHPASCRPCSRILSLAQVRLHQVGVPPGSAEAQPDVKQISHVYCLLRQSEHLSWISM